jgi:DNA-binding MarR family transcriptional regulator
MTFTNLEKRLQLSKNTITELCARAEGAGLLAREPSQTDQRVTYLRLTREGERRLLGVLGEGDDYRRELMKAFESLAESFRLASRPPRVRSKSRSA